MCCGPRAIVAVAFIVLPTTPVIDERVTVFVYSVSARTDRRIHGMTCG
jgi:hypothetical protein